MFDNKFTALINWVSILVFLFLKSVIFWLIVVIALFNVLTLKVLLFKSLIKLSVIIL